MSALQEYASAWEEYLALPDTTPAEFIDGQIYYMASPSRIHQKLVSELHGTIYNHIKSKGGSCEIYPAPFMVKLDKRKENYFEPDLSIICDKEKLTDAGCVGAPDWIIEIASPGDLAHDYIAKLSFYRDAGVREYWIVNPMEKTVLVYHLEEPSFQVMHFRFQDRIPAGIFEDLSIDFATINETLD